MTEFTAKEDFYYNGCCIVYVENPDKPIKCGICNKETHYIDLGWEYPICSPACYEAMSEMYNEELRKLNLRWAEEESKLVDSNFPF